MTLRNVISGGQTGVDRAALDAALMSGLTIGGWCPKGRRAEGGAIPEKYPLVETPEDDYDTRTDWNVRDSDGTLVINQGPLSGGTLKTVRLAQSRYRRPVLVVDLDHPPGIDEVIAWVTDHRIGELNVAGPREGKCPGIYESARAWLLTVFLALGPNAITIQNCVFRFRCTRTWESLERVRNHDDVRNCGECRRDVFLCHTDRELASHVRAGHCVAFKRPGVSGREGHYIGSIEYMP